MPSIKVVPEHDGSRVGYTQVQEAFGPGATGPLQIVAPQADAAVVAARAQADPGIAAVMPPQRGRRPGADPGVPRRTRRTRRWPPPSTGCAAPCRRASWSAARPPRTTTSRRRSPARRRWSSAWSSALGFLLLLVALQAPVIAAVGVLTNLLATGAAFGVAKLIFQDGHLSGLLGFESQGFLDAWGPVFFFAMIFAISMDYTVFLLSSAKEHWDRTHDAKDAMVGGLAHSGRVIFAAGAVMVAVFFTFALSGPLPPKEMGVILGVAVLLDAALVRLLLVPCCCGCSAAGPGGCPSRSTGCCPTSASATP